MPRTCFYIESLARLRPVAPAGPHAGTVATLLAQLAAALLSLAAVYFDEERARRWFFLSSAGMASWGAAGPAEAKAA